MQYPFSIYFLNFFVQKVRKRALNRFVFVKKNNALRAHTETAKCSFYAGAKKSLDKLF